MTQDIEKYVDEVCAKVYEDWSLEVLPEVRKEWRKSVRTTLTKVTEEARREERERIRNSVARIPTVHQLAVSGRTNLFWEVTGEDFLANLQSDK